MSHCTYCNKRIKIQPNGTGNKAKNRNSPAVLQPAAPPAPFRDTVVKVQILRTAVAAYR